MDVQRRPANRRPTVRRIFVLAAAATAIALSPFAIAQGGQEGEWEIGPYVGFGFPDDYDLADDSGSFEPDDDLLVGIRAGYFLSERWSLEGSLQRLASELGDDTALAGTDVDLDALRLNALLNFGTGSSVRPFITLGVGYESFDVDGFSSEGDLGLNAGGGVRWMLGDSFGLRLDGRYVFVDTGDPIDGSQGNVEGTIGLLWAFGGGPPADSDRDGVVDRDDECPNTPAGAVVDANGCAIDGDGDGVPDGIDRCLDTPRGNAVDANGCGLDADGDGVNDARDRCPDTPEGAKVDEAGCPLDSDGDGVFDGLDRCPGTPAGTPVDDAGCPLDSDGDGVDDGTDDCPDTPTGVKVDEVGCPLDSDRDGVFDGIDRCPNTPAGSRVDEKGCEVLFEGEAKTLVLEDVFFEFDSAVLTAESKRRLDSVASALKESFPGVRIEVAGHTDSRGKADYNLGLSTRRAEAVAAYLAGRGVDRSRMVSKGYGETEPRADNDTDAGRALNRRVELERLD